MSKFFINRPIVAMVISIVMVLVGLVVMRKLPISQFPDIVPPMINVTTTYVGASSVDVEQSVATPLEQQVNGVENMIYMKSINANDGTLTLQVSFDVGSDLDMSNVLTQNRVSQAQASLPGSVKNYGVTVKKSLVFPLMLVTLKSPDGSYDNNFLSNYAAININDLLARIKGVGDVKLFGGSDYAMRLWVKPDRLRQGRAHGAGHREGGAGTECRLPGRPDRRPPGASGNRFHLYGSHAGTVDGSSKSSGTS